MGWGNCGVDSKGRPIGYVFEATCDHPNCDVKIDRGVAHACGGMHGENTCSCEGYFCEKHLGVPYWDGMYDVIELEDIDMHDVVYEYLSETEDTPYICEECQHAFVKYVQENLSLWLDDVKNTVETMRKRDNVN